MTIKTKLILLVLFPVLGLVYLGFENYRDNQQIVKNMNDLQSLSNLAVRISALVHETQKERGLTAGYLGAKDPEFLTKLKKQRKLVDGQLEKLNEFLAGFDSSRFNAEFESALETAMAPVGELREIRSRVENLDIKTPQAIGYYTDLNTKMLNTVGKMTTVSAHPELTVTFVSYVSFLKAKERAGIERAVLSNTFARDSFGPGMYQKFVSLTSQQNSFLGEFALTAAPGAREFYEAEMNAPEVAEVERYRSVAHAKAVVGGFGEDAATWFDTITKKINRLKTVENHLSEDLQQQATQVRDAASWNLWTTTGLTLAMVVVVGVMSTFVVRSIRTRIDRVRHCLETVANGDLTVKLDDSQSDELGQMAKSMNEFLEQLRVLMQQIAGSATKLSGSSTNLSTTASELAREAEETLHRSSTVSSAAAQTSASFNTISTSTESVSGNVRSVATAIEELTASIGEIAKNAEQASTVVNNAAEMTRQSNEKMNSLNEASQKIGAVIEAIQDIAEQTNLLALNATIEAARAGEAGKGFAVVANEVKSLAQQSASATEDIRHLIEGIQFSTRESVASIEQIETIVNDVSEISRTIASAVEEQRITTHEISSTVSSTATSADTVATNITESVGAIEEILQSMLSVNESAKHSSEGAGQTTSASQELHELADSLQKTVARYQVS